MKRRVGEFVEFDGLLTVVVAVHGENSSIPEDHIGLWFGPEQTVRKSEGGVGGEVPQIWVVPEEYCKDAVAPDQQH